MGKLQRDKVRQIGRQVHIPDHLLGRRRPFSVDFTQFVLQKENHLSIIQRPHTFRLYLTANWTEEQLTCSWEEPVHRYPVSVKRHRYL